MGGNRPFDWFSDDTCNYQVNILKFWMEKMKQVEIGLFLIGQNGNWMWGK
jgi:hypothetical protein